MIMTKISVRAIAHGEAQAAIYTTVGNVVRLMGVMPLHLASERGFEVEPEGALTLFEQPASPDSTGEAEED